jgi:hypothetical protein
VDRTARDYAKATVSCPQKEAAEKLARGVTEGGGSVQGRKADGSGAGVLGRYGDGQAV